MSEVPLGSGISSRCADLLGREVRNLGTGDLAVAREHTDAAVSFVRAYTRAHGFEFGDFPNEELASVVITAAARSMSNPHNVQSQTSGPFSVTHFQVGGFTLAERAVLDRYRVRAR